MRFALLNWGMNWTRSNNSNPNCHSSHLNDLCVPARSWQIANCSFSDKSFENFDKSSKILDFISNKNSKDDQISSFEEYLQNYKDLPFEFDPTVVRGLEYYTGLVFEVELTTKVVNDKGKEVIFGSVAGGGRYDKLIARFGKEDVPATGISIGIDRLIYAIEQFNKIQSNKKPLIIIANLIPEQISNYLSIADLVRDEGYACEIFYGSTNLSKQLKYSDKRKASLVIIIGEDEIKNQTISIKNLIVGKEL